MGVRRSKTGRGHVSGAWCTGWGEFGLIQRAIKMIQAVKEHDLMCILGTPLGCCTKYGSWECKSGDQ
jgi:hypothetical protein